MPLSATRLSLSNNSVSYSDVRVFQRNFEKNNKMEAVSFKYDPARSNPDRPFRKPWGKHREERGKGHVNTEMQGRT